MSSATTDIKGYFNGNSYPIQIQSAALNLYVQIKSKDYLRDRSGRLINDPRLASFARPGSLSIERIKAQIPINSIDLGTSSHSGVSATATPPPVVKAPAASKAQIRAYTMEQAKKAGKVSSNRRPDPFDKAPTEIAEGLEPAAESAPYMDGSDDVSTSPAGAMFICPADGKRFDNRAELVDYVKSKFPYVMEEVDKSYPLAKKEQAPVAEKKKPGRKPSKVKADEDLAEPDI